MDSPLTAAAFQMATGFDVEENARKILDALARAAEHGADLLVVPECALSGYPPEKDLDFSALEDAERRIAARTAEARIHLALGTTRRQDGRWSNSAVLFSPGGKEVARYDKTHGTEGDNQIFTPGSELRVFKVGQWTVGLQICFDMRFPENWRILRRRGADLVIHLSNASRGDGWKVPVLEGAIRSRAADNGMFVVSANDARRPQMMVSAICDPNGCDLARAPENEEALIYAEMDRSAVKTTFLEARRTDLWSRPENRDLLLG